MGEADDDRDFDPDDHTLDTDGDEHQWCWRCGGDGVAEYIDCPEAWGEDCPSELNHLIECPCCGGSGLAEDCWYW